MSRGQPFDCVADVLTVELQLVVVRHDVLVGAVGHAEAAGDDAQLGEAELLVEVAGHCVGGHDGVELQDPKAVCSALCETVPYKRLSGMATARFAVHGVARVADVAAAAHVVGVEDVHAHDLAGLRDAGNAAVRLLGEESCGILGG